MPTNEQDQQSWIMASGKIVCIRTIQTLLYMCTYINICLCIIMSIIMLQTILADAIIHASCSMVVKTLYTYIYIWTYRISNWKRILKSILNSLCLVIYFMYAYIYIHITVTSNTPCCRVHLWPLISLPSTRNNWQLPISWIVSHATGRKCYSGCMLCTFNIILNVVILSHCTI